MSSLIDLFGRLNCAASADATSFPSARLTQGHDHHVGKDEAGKPLILIGVRRLPGEPIAVSYVLENIRVDHELQCRIVDSKGNARVDLFSVIRCLSTDVGLQTFFLCTMETLLNFLPPTPTLSELAKAVDTLIVLFQALSRPASGPVIGLWGELFLIAESTDAGVALASWHDDAHETCDFSSGSERLEVKCSGDRTRRHHFSLEQCHPPPESTQLIVSLFVESAAGGVSLGELWDTVRDRVGGDPVLTLKLDRVCIEALGSSWQEARARRYDQQRASASLLLFDCQAIPRVEQPVPPGVTEVHFRSDLGLAIPVEVGDYLGKQGLFDTVLGRLRMAS